MGSVVVAHNLSCPEAYWIFPEQGSNCIPCIGRQVLNHWTTKEVPQNFFNISHEPAKLKEVLDSIMGFPGGSDVKESACSVGDPGLIPGSGRSPAEGNGNPLHYACLENAMDGGSWQATVHGVAKSQTQLSDFFLSTGVYSGYHCKC